MEAMEDDCAPGEARTDDRCPARHSMSFNAAQRNNSSKYAQRTRSTVDRGYTTTRPRLADDTRPVKDVIQPERDYVTSDDTVPSAVSADSTRCDVHPSTDRLMTRRLIFYPPSPTAGGDDKDHWGFQTEEVLADWSETKSPPLVGRCKLNRRHPS